MEETTGRKSVRHEKEERWEKQQERSKSGIWGGRKKERKCKLGRYIATKESKENQDG